LKSPVLFYDGYCAFCNYWVKFLLKNSRHGEVFFATLESKALVDLAKIGTVIPEIDSALFWDGELLFTKSDVAIQALKYSKGGWKFVGKLISIFPRFFRDFCYDKIASIRYRIFGRYDQCPLIPAEYQNRFLP